jgi:hypothetical protein
MTISVALRLSVFTLDCGTVASGANAARWMSDVQAESVTQRAEIVRTGGRRLEWLVRVLSSHKAARIIGWTVAVIAALTLIITADIGAVLRPHRALVMGETSALAVLGILLTGLGLVVSRHQQRHVLARATALIVTGIGLVPLWHLVLASLGMTGTAAWLRTNIVAPGAPDVATAVIVSSCGIGALAALYRTRSLIATAALAVAGGMLASLSLVGLTLHLASAVTLAAAANSFATPLPITRWTGADTGMVAADRDDRRTACHTGRLERHGTERIGVAQRADDDRRTRHRHGGLTTARDGAARRVAHDALQRRPGFRMA